VGYEEAGQLTEKVRRRPYAVLLLDEIEKAHPDVFNILLQIFEDGRLTDSKGRMVSFKNTIIIMTSNLGSDYINKMATIGFNTKEDLAQRESMREKVFDSLRDGFRPEFLNRIDEIVIFNYLQKEQIKNIVDLEMSKVEKRLAAKEIKIDISDKAKELLVKEGFDPNLGARPLKRVIQRLILDPLSIKIVTNEISEGSRVLIDEQNGKMVFESPKVLPKTIERRKLASSKK
jgi:ATP-dependent Clp protease ATP-binding subunit ClpA